jgi:hypothetical protein
MELLYSYKVCWADLKVELTTTELIYESGFAYMFSCEHRFYHGEHNNSERCREDDGR